MEEIQKRLDKNSKGILINSPANPTGTLLSGGCLQRICDLGLTVFADELYHGLVYEGREYSALKYTQNCIVFNGFSKLYAMTGWRLGYMIVPESMVATMQKIQQNFLICTSAVAQWAGLAALTQAGREVESMRETFDERRMFLLNRDISLYYLIFLMFSTVDEFIKIVEHSFFSSKAAFPASSFFFLLPGILQSKPGSF